VNKPSSAPGQGAFSPSWRQIAGFLAGAVALLAALQAAGSYKRDESMKWFDLVLKDPAPRPFQALLVGTSRVAAGVDASAFDQELSSALGVPFRSLNLGMGYTSMASYYFALKAIRERKPEALRGTIVLVEAPKGLPEYATWDGDWIVADGTEPLARYLGPGDLPKFVSRSPTPLVHKAAIVARVLLGYRESYSRLRGHLVNELTSVLEPPSGTDLSAAGGIRADSAGIRTVRAAAIEVAKAAAADTTPWVGYGSSILKEIVDLVQASGGRVVFFDMPISDVQAAGRTTPRRLREAVLFEGEAKAWGTPILRTDFASTDADYPDYWHLSSRRSAELGRLLGRALLDSLHPDRPDAGVRNFGS